MREAKRQLKAYQKKHRDARHEDDRQARNAKRERELVRWVHQLGSALRRHPEASGLSDAGLTEKMVNPTEDPRHLDDFFSDRVQLGDIKSFVDACGGFLDIIVDDKDGQIVSARELAPIGDSATRSTRVTRTATPLDDEALTQRGTANVLQRLHGLGDHRLTEGGRPNVHIHPPRGAESSVPDKR